MRCSVNWIVGLSPSCPGARPARNVNAGTSSAIAPTILLALRMDLVSLWDCNAERALALEQSGMRQVRLDAERRRVAFDRTGVEINLGSIGKGYALDQVARLLHDDWRVRSALIHGG